MNEGRVAQMGTPHEIYDRPATPFVASFVGGANVLRGQMRDGRVSVGAMAVAVAAPAGAPDGTAVSAFVRPHDVKLTKADGRARPRDLQWRASSAWRALGGYVKLSLRLPDGEPMTVRCRRRRSRRWRSPRAIG